MKHGDVLFIDDTRSGVSSSGFAFWNVIVVDEEGKAKYGMGAMTMTTDDGAVEWILKTLATLCPPISNIIRSTMSDLGKFVYVYFIC